MSQVCLVTALPAESRVFIDTYALQRVDTRGLKLYANENLWLVETGLGKLKAAAAVSAILHHIPDISSLINVGIAGADRPLGSLWLAHQIEDAGSGYTWYPHLPPRRLSDALDTLSVLTVDKPSSQYHPDQLLDMEASGVIMAAKSYLGNHAIQTIKVVSDNPENSTSRLTKALVQDYMEPTVSPVNSLVNWYLSQTKQADQNLPWIEHTLSLLQQKIRFSVTQQHQLTLQLQRIANLDKTSVDITPLLALTSAKRVLDKLTEISNKLDMSYR